MRKRARTSAGALASIVLSALALGACHSNSAEMHQAGPALTLKLPASGCAVYFISDPQSTGDSTLTPSVRKGTCPTPEQAVRALLEGPLPEEEKAGMLSALPEVPVAERAVSLRLSPDEPPVLQLPFPLGNLSRDALKQLDCTICATVESPTKPLLTLEGRDGRRHAVRPCSPAGSPLDPPQPGPS